MLRVRAIEGPSCEPVRGKTDALSRSRRLWRVVGWSDKISLEDGLDKTTASVDRFSEELKAQPEDYQDSPWSR